MHTLLFGTLSLQKSIDYECFCKIVKILKKILWLLTHHSRGIPKSFSFGSNRQIQIFSTDFSTKKCFWVFFSAWIEIHVGLQTKTKTQTSLVFEFTRIFLLPFKLKECSWKFVRSGNNESFTVTNRICIFAQFYPFFLTLRITSDFVLSSAHIDIREILLWTFFTFPVSVSYSFSILLHFIKKCIHALMSIRFLVP